MGGIANEGEAGCDKAARHEHLKRPGLAGAIKLDGTEAATGALFELAEEGCIVEGHEAAGLVVFLAPSNATAIAGKRQHRERAAWEEMLDRVAPVRQVMAHGDGDAGLGVAPAGGFDPGELAQGGAAAVGCDQQFGLERAGWRERDGDRFGASAESSDCGLGENAYGGHGGDGGCERCFEGGIGNDVRGGLVAADVIVVGQQNGAHASVQGRIRDVDGGYGLG